MSSKQCFVGYCIVSASIGSRCKWLQVQDYGVCLLCSFLKNAVFSRLYLLPSSGGSRIIFSFGCIRWGLSQLLELRWLLLTDRAEQVRPQPSTEGRNISCFRNIVFFPNSKQRMKFRNTVNQNEIHHCQNPLELTTESCSEVRSLHQMNVPSFWKLNFGSR